MTGRRHLWMVLALLTAGALTLGACGSRAVGDSPCAQLCEDSRQQLIDNFGVAPDQIDCSEPAWQQADTCAKCEALLRDRYDVKPTDVCSYFQ